MIYHSQKHIPGSQDYRMERFAEIRASHPTLDTEEIWEALAQAEIDDAQTMECRRIAAEMEN